jgi:hypothetical protein
MDFQNHVENPGKVLMLMRIMPKKHGGGGAK